MDITLHDIAALVQGEIAGDATVRITGIAGVSDVRAGEITFLQSPKHVQEVRESQAAAVLAASAHPGLSIPQVIVKNPQYAFARLLARFYAIPRPPVGVSDRAWVAETAVLGDETAIAPFVSVDEGARIGARCILYPGVYIGAGVVLGDDCIVYPNVTLREGVILGNRVIIQPGAVIGADGFGYVYAEGQHQKIPQTGIVVLEDDVEVGANTTIDRATTGKTVIGAGTKIDNLVQIGHNCIIGRQAIIVSQVGIGGSSRVGDGVMMGGQAGIADHAIIASGTMLAAGSGVMPGTLEKGVYAGVPVMPHREWLRTLAVTAQLPELKKRLLELEQTVKQLQDKNEEAQ